MILMEEQAFNDSLIEIPYSKENIKNLANNLPEDPGVYKFLDQEMQPIYIGKAKNLKNRVISYFRDSEKKSKKVKKLVKYSKKIEITLTESELEALLIEQHLIKQTKPRFNVQFKDDKGYPWIKIDTSKEFPSAKSHLGKKDLNSKFFGPFPSSYAVQDSLKLLQKTFKLRNCSDSFFKNRTRPCIQNEIGRCSAPCIGKISKKEYLEDVSSAQALLSGKSESLISSFYQSMDKHSKEKSFEKAAIYRDKISSLRDIQRVQSVAGHSMERDAISIFTVNGQTKTGITHVKGGWVIGHENFIQKNVPIHGSVIENFIVVHYLNDVFCPSNIVIAEPIQNKGIIESALSQYHGKKIKIITKLGKRDLGLITICKNNTKFSFSKSRNSQSIAPVLNSLRAELSMDHAIELIESYDISHHSSSGAVGGCVVYSDRGKIKDKYRLFNISKKNSGNDIASMVEVIERRFKNNTLDLDEPNLIIIDGGKVHLSHVSQKMDELGLGHICLIAISKGARRKAEFDSIHKQDGTLIKVSKGSLAHKFIQEIRDETHRFSITNQKKKLRKYTTSSSLDSIPGVGLERKKKLLRFFGTVDQIKRASIRDLMNVPGLGKKTATLIYNQLK